MREIVQYLLIPIFIGAGGGMAIAAVRSHSQVFVLGWWFATPFLIYTIWFLTIPAAEGGFLAWWLAGLVIFAPSWLAFAIGAIAGLVGARRYLTP